MRPLNTWLPQTIGLLAAATITILATAPHQLTWPRLLLAAIFITTLATTTCAATMFLTYVMLPKTEATFQRTCATAACIPALVILLQQTSMWAPFVAAFLVWTILPAQVNPKPQWKKFAVALTAAVLLQIGIASALADESLISAIAIGFAAAPILWRIRQERSLRGPFRPRITMAIATLFAILALTHYLPLNSGSAYEAAYAKSSSDGKKATAASAGFSVGSKYRGVILSPEEEQHVILVPPIPMMGRDPFRLHKDPLGIPFFGVYWFFQAPDSSPNEDAYRVKGNPDNITFHSADMAPLKMEAHQNLGRLIDMSACSRIDIAIRNADIFVGSLAMELVLVNTTLAGRPWQSLGTVAISDQKRETLSFKIPQASRIRQFDELTIRFPRAKYRATRSAKIAIDRFYLIPRL
jgi:hypothetical protein